MAFQILSLILCVALGGCHGGGASALTETDEVFVPLDGASLSSLNDALGEKGYGNVTFDELEREFTYQTAAFGPAVVAYSDSDAIPDNTLYQPMSVRECFEEVLEDDAAEGLVLDPHSSRRLEVTKAAIRDALSR